MGREAVRDTRSGVRGGKPQWLGGFSCANLVSPRAVSSCFVLLLERGPQSQSQPPPGPPFPHWPARLQFHPFSSLSPGSRGSNMRANNLGACARGGSVSAYVCKPHAVADFRGRWVCHAFRKGAANGARRVLNPRTNERTNDGISPLPFFSQPRS